jgi:hypothetical protein
MPGAFFAKDFSVHFDVRAAGCFGLGMIDDGVVLQLEFIGFVFIIRGFDEKIQAAAYGTLHRFTPYPHKTETRSTKFEIRNKYKIRISKFSKQIK